MLQISNSNLMPIEGEILINVEAELGEVRSVVITSSRLLHITQLLEGKSIISATDLINRTYSLCNTAHRLSLLRLLDSTALIELSNNELSAYQLLLDLETVKEHCFSIFTKWHQGFGNNIDPSFIDILKTLKQISAMLFSSADPLSLVDKELLAFNSIDNFLSKLDGQLNRSLIGNQADHVGALTDIDNFDKWLGNSNSNCANFLNYLKIFGFSGLGDTEACHLADLNLQKIGVLMQDVNFIKQPVYQNTVFETTPFSRQNKHQLIGQLMIRHGNGLFTRSVAQLLEVFGLLHNIRHNYAGIKSERISHKIRDFDSELNAIVHLEAARGRLFHQVTLRENMIKSYQILAPTEWNFHPKGVLYRMIGSINYNDKEDLVNKIKLLVNAIDPCVGYRLEVVCY